LGGLRIDDLFKKSNCLVEAFQGSIFALEPVMRSWKNMVPKVWHPVSGEKWLLDIARLL